MTASQDEKKPYVIRLTSYAATRQLCDARLTNALSSPPPEVSPQPYITYAPPPPQASSHKHSLAAMSKAIVKTASGATASSTSTCSFVLSTSIRESGGSIVALPITEGEKEEQGAEHVGLLEVVYGYEIQTPILLINM
ncbi:hypothetical protein EDB19DRAFT_2029536 [Suillus lakei]|nr:hypothetical protein EDB19DRAFT_2029536 [Suillus lakei]